VCGFCAVVVVVKKSRYAFERSFPTWETWIFPLVAFSSDIEILLGKWFFFYSTFKRLVCIQHSFSRICWEHKRFIIPGLVKMEGFPATTLLILMIYGVKVVNIFMDCSQEWGIEEHKFTWNYIFTTVPPQRFPNKRIVQPNKVDESATSIVL
jgi:hypothetical protein